MYKYIFFKVVIVQKREDVCFQIQSLVSTSKYYTYIFTELVMRK